MLEYAVAFASASVAADAANGPARRRDAASTASQAASATRNTDIGSKVAKVSLKTGSVDAHNADAMIPTARPNSEDAVKYSRMVAPSIKAIERILAMASTATLLAMAPSGGNNNRWPDTQRGPSTSCQRTSPRP